MTARLTFLALIVLICPEIGISQSPGSTSQSDMSQSVFLIMSVRQEFDPVTPWKTKPVSQGIGSGFLIEGNLFITNAHNVADVRYLEVRKQNSPRRYLASVHYVGHDCDLALLTVQDPTFFTGTNALQLGGLAQVNSTVQTYGFPVGGRQISTTEGVVSRIQMDVYAHSRADSHLVVQTDAAINPGNSGGPVLQDGHVVGVAFQGLRSADNIGYMIPTTVIRHFLSDIEDGTYDGFGSIGFSFYPGLHSKSYAEYLRLPPGQEGVVVLRTMLHSSIADILQPGDVLTQVDSYNIDNDGMIRIHGLRLNMGEAVEQKQIGDTIDLTYYRNGAEQRAQARVALNRPILPFWRQYDHTPRYIVYGGLVFVPLSRNYLETWGPSWVTDMPFYLRYLFIHSDEMNLDPQRTEYIVLSEILPHEINAYSQEFKHHVVKNVDGTTIYSLSDLEEVFWGAEIPENHEITFFDSDRPLILNSEQAQTAQNEILSEYDIPTEKRNSI